MPKIEYFAYTLIQDGAEITLKLSREQAKTLRDQLKADLSADSDNGEV